MTGEILAFTPQKSGGGSAETLRDLSKISIDRGGLGPREYTPALTRDRLLAALSAIGAAGTGIAEAMREDKLEQLLAQGMDPQQKDWLPLGEEAIEPLVDALSLVIHAIGCPRALHRISVDLDRFSLGDDD